MNVAMPEIRARAIGLLVFAILALMPIEARADCSDPAGKEGEYIYNVDFKTMQFCNGTDWISMTGSASGGGSGITDGNKGDITVSGAGATWTINGASVQYSKIQNIGAGTLLGRYAATSGPAQEITLGSGLSLNTTTGVLSATGSLSGTGAAGYVPYWSSATALSYDNTSGGEFYWDSTNHRLGIGITAPTQALDVNGKITTNGLVMKLVSGAAIPSNGAPTASNFTNMIAAFAATSCPANWTPYVAAYGRFLRGIDPTGATTVDPRGTVAPGTQQADDTKLIPDVWLWRGSEYASGMAAGSAYNGVGNTQARPSGWPQGTETRPKNVAVIFCQYAGTGMGGGASALSGLTDVDTTGLASGKVLTYNGTKWVPGSAAGGSSSGTVGYIQISGGSGAFSSDSTSGGQLFWDSTNHRLGIGTALPVARLQIADSSVPLIFDESDQSGVTGFWRLAVDGGAWRIDQNTAVGRSLSTYRTPLGIDGSGNVHLGGYTAAGGGTDTLYVSANGGNVGIGTTSPAQKLDVAGTVKASALAGAWDTSASGYTRLGNFQIEWGTAPAVAHTSASGSVYFGLGVSTSYAVAFKAGVIPVLTITPDYNTDGVFGCVPVSTSNAGFTPICWGSIAATTGTLRYVAMGVWQ